MTHVDWFGNTKVSNQNGVTHEWTQGFL